MAFSEDYFQAYQRLPEQLAEQYSNLNFDNHCYLRIALDNTIGDKWDAHLPRPAYKNLSQLQLRSVLKLLQQYQNDKHLLLQHNKASLAYRKAWKRKSTS